MKLNRGKTVGGMLFADDFVGISDSKDSLQKLIDIRSLSIFIIIIIIVIIIIITIIIIIITTFRKVINKYFFCILLL